MTDLSMLKTIYDRDGIVIVPDVFTPGECDAMREAAYAVKEHEIVEAGYPHVPSEKRYNKRSLIFFPALASEYLNKIRTDKRMVDLVKFFIGDDVKQINNQVYFREAGDMDQFAWHRDTIFREPEYFTNDVEHDYFQTIIAVDDIVEDNGAIEFIPNSRQMPMPFGTNLRVFNRGGLKGRKYTAKKGSVLIWSIMTLHGSEMNKSKQNRMTYMNGFCRSKACSAYPDYLVDGEIINELDPTQIP